VDLQVRPDTYGVTRGLDDVAFLNPDGSKVLVDYDNSPEQALFQVAWDGRAFVYSLAARRHRDLHLALGRRGRLLCRP